MPSLEEDQSILIDTYKKGDFSKCVELAEIFVKKYPHKGDGFNVLVLSYKAVGRTEEAIKIFLYIIEKLPKIKAYKVNLGNLYLNSGRLIEAKKIYLEVLKLHPNDENVLCSMGSIYLQEEDDSTAKNTYKKVIEINPLNSKANYELANIYKSIRDFKLAAKYFRKSSERHSNSNYLEALLCDDRQEQFFNEYSKLNDQEITTPLLGGAIQHASIAYGKQNNRSFCNDIFNYIDLNKVDENQFSEFHREKIIDFHKKQELNYRHQPMLHSGKQSAGNIFRNENESIQLLKTCIENQINNYQQKFQNNPQNFIKFWPKKYILYGWIVTMESGGFLSLHNHKEGWLSGSFYLKVPKRNSYEDQGSIVFSELGPLYPKKEKIYQTKTIKVETRDICLFPSSIFHSTVPITTDEERIVFVFDIIPS